jgi:hypothetical protein
MFIAVSAVLPIWMRRFARVNLIDLELLASNPQPFDVCLRRTLGDIGSHIFKGVSGGKRDGCKMALIGPGGCMSPSYSGTPPTL